MNIEQKEKQDNKKLLLGLGDLSRSGHVTRWHSVRTYREQTLAEHHYMVAMIANKLAKDILGTDITDSERLQLLEYALFPSEEKYFIRYHVQYRAYLGFFMAAYENFIDAAAVVRSNRQKQDCSAEIDSARRTLARYRKSPSAVRLVQ